MLGGDWLCFSLLFLSLLRFSLWNREGSRKYGDEAYHACVFFFFFGLFSHLLNQTIPSFFSSRLCATQDLKLCIWTAADEESRAASFFFFLFFFFLSPPSFYFSICLVLF